MKIYKRENGSPDYYSMFGMSMFPTLRPGEGVTIDSVADKRSFEKGDIIIYPDPRYSSRNIIHRIIRISENGYKTRGDNNSREDNYIVPFESVCGKALTVRRINKTLSLAGKFRGQMLHHYLRIRKSCWKYLSLFSGVIDKSGIFNVFHNFVKVDIVLIKKGSHMEEMLIHDNKLIGKRCVSTGKWIIRFPYKYFINKKKLC